MKAKQIRKLRLKLRQYGVTESSGLFGRFSSDFISSDFRLPQIKLLARSPEEAVYRYFRWYYRKYRCQSDHFFYDPQETLRMWGKIEVVDEKGLIHYYR